MINFYISKKRAKQIASNGVEAEIVAFEQLCLYSMNSALCSGDTWSYLYYKIVYIYFLGLL